MTDFDKAIALDRVRTLDQIALDATTLAARIAGMGFFEAGYLGGALAENHPQIAKALALSIAEELNLKLEVQE